MLLMAVIALIVENKLHGMDVKKVEGHDHRFRVRVGKFRIVYDRTQNGNQIIRVDLRNEQTYKF
jgi:mRNA-degrading endonuclease RelE of RelBE toxin-antitoxin system